MDEIKLNKIFILIIVVLSFVLYGNTIKNEYSLDDKLVVNNDNVKRGVSGIYDIFSSQYYKDKTKKFGYRPITQVTFAIERTLFGKNPHLSHFFNILFYIINLLILYKLLKKIFKNYSIWFSFIIVVLFAAHPIHTEVVASLKNREEILCYIFALLSVYFFIKYSDSKKLYYIIPGLIFYATGFITKMSIITFIIVIPLFQYFFSNANWKNILITVFLLAITTIAIRRTTHKIFDMDFTPYYFENPLYFIHDIWVRLGTTLISLLYYLKLLVLPHPLVCYYGYNTIPVDGFNNLLVWVSLVMHISLAVYAVLGLKQKKILSFVILYYFITISIFSNLFSPVPGIIAERLLYNVSLSFVIFLTILIFKLSALNPMKEFKFSPKSRRIFIVLLTLIILPYSIKTIARNTSWKNHITLYKNDVKYAPKSYKINDLYARELIQIGNFNKEKHNVEKKILKAIDYLKKTAEIYPEYYQTWNNIALIYTDYLQNYDTAIFYFKKTLEADPNYDIGYLNLGYCYEKTGDTINAIQNYKLACNKSDSLLQARYNLANLLAKTGKITEAIDINNKIIKKDSNLYIPYLNIGNYYFISNNYNKAIEYYIKSLDKNLKQPKLLQDLSALFLHAGDTINSVRYFQLYQQIAKK